MDIAFQIEVIEISISVLQREKLKKMLFGPFRDSNNSFGFLQIMPLTLCVRVKSKIFYLIKWKFGFETLVASYNVTSLAHS